MKQQPTYTQKRGIIYANTAGGKPVKFAVAWDTPNAIRIINRLNELTEIVNSGLRIDDVVESPHADNSRAVLWDRFTQTLRRTK